MNPSAPKSNSDSLIQTALDSIGAAKSALQSEIAGYQEAMRTLQKRRSELAESPISFDEYCERLKQHIHFLGDQFARKNILTAETGRHPDSRKTWSEYESKGITTLVDIMNIAPSMNAMCFYFPEVIHQRLVDVLRSKYAQGWGKGSDVPDAQRGALIADIDVQLRELKHQSDQLSGRLYRLETAVAASS